MFFWVIKIIGETFLKGTNQTHKVEIKIQKDCLKIN